MNLYIIRQQQIKQELFPKRAVGNIVAHFIVEHQDRGGANKIERIAAVVTVAAAFGRIERTAAGVEGRHRFALC